MWAVDNCHFALIIFFKMKIILKFKYLCQVNQETQVKK